MDRQPQGMPERAEPVTALPREDFEGTRSNKGYAIHMAARVSRVELLHDALELSADDRAELAAELLASLDGPPDPGASAAWTDEIRRRVDRALAGDAKGTPWPEVRDKLRGRWGT